MKVALYLRVSTDRQETENQAIVLREFAAKQGWEICHEYCDCESGAKAHRVAFKQMFADAAQRKFDLVMFWALDRLSREGVLEALQHLRRLESYGVGYKSFTEQFVDSCGVFKDAILAIMATLAKQERVKRSVRTKAGIEDYTKDSEHYRTLFSGYRILAGDRLMNFVARHGLTQNFLDEDAGGNANDEWMASLGTNFPILLPNPDIAAAMLDIVVARL